MLNVVVVIPAATAVVVAIFKGQQIIGDYGKIIIIVFGKLKIYIVGDIIGFSCVYISN